MCWLSTLSIHVILLLSSDQMWKQYSIQVLAGCDMIYCMVQPFTVSRTIWWYHRGSSCEVEGWGQKYFAAYVLLARKKVCHMLNRFDLLSLNIVIWKFTSIWCHFRSTSICISVNACTCNTQTAYVYIRMCAHAKNVCITQHAFNSLYHIWLLCRKMQKSKVVYRLLGR